jgi:hypothetical protein
VLFFLDGKTLPGKDPMEKRRETKKMAGKSEKMAGKQLRNAETAAWAKRGDEKKNWGENAPFSFGDKNKKRFEFFSGRIRNGIF